MSQNPLPASLEGRRPGRTLARSKILVVDDQRPNLLLVHRVLQTAGFEQVRLEDDPRVALNTTHEWGPDLILLDLHMPGLDGVEFLELLRGRQSPVEFLPVLVLTADAHTDSLRRALVAGANDYATKPFDIDELTLRVRNLLSIRICHEDLKHRNDELAAELRTRALNEAETEADRKKRSKAIDQIIYEGGPPMVYQPVVELATRRTIGFEALARFEGHPDPTPDRWFRDAFEMGNGVDLEIVAVKRALSELRALSAEQFMAVNLSPATAFAPDLQHALSELPLHRIVLEITEHEAVENYEDLARVITSLRERGARLAVDDAGAGFASMRHILRLTPDIIKLDLQLTRDIDSDPVRRALAAALVQFGRDIGSVVTAEGIETERELDTLIDLGVTYGQGYYLAYPAALASPASSAVGDPASA